MKNNYSRRMFLQYAGTGALAAGVTSYLGSSSVGAETRAEDADWSMTATII